MRHGLSRPRMWELSFLSQAAPELPVRMPLSAVRTRQRPARARPLWAARLSAPSLLSGCGSPADVLLSEPSGGLQLCPTGQVVWAVRAALGSLVLWVGLPWWGACWLPSSGDMAEGEPCPRRPHYLGNSLVLAEASCAPGLWEGRE